MRSQTSPSRSPGLRAAPIVLLLTAIVLLLAAPGASAGTATSSATSDVPPGKAWVRVGHFVPGMGSTTITLQPLRRAGHPITLAGDATYGQVTAYEKLPPGSYTATVRETSADPAAAPMLSRTFEIAADDARTVAVLGTADAPRLALLTDDLTPPGAGTARVRLLSASQAAGAVTVTAVDGPTIAEGAVLGQATAYATVPAGSWTLQLQSSEAQATLQAVPVASGSVYTVVVLDAGAQKVSLDVVTDAAGAVVSPQGGARTGGGGTAPGRVVTTTGHQALAGWPVGLAGFAGLGLLVAYAAARRGALARS